MKLKKLLFIIAFLGAVLCLGSCAMSADKYSVVIMDTEHGTLDVEIIGVDSNYRYFSITAEPEEGYEILESNIFVYEYKDGNSSSYYRHIVSPREGLKNQFSFSYDDKDNLVISGIFTKISAKN